MSKNKRTTTSQLFVRLIGFFIYSLTAVASALAAPPTDISISTGTVDEHIDTSSGVSIGILTTTDPDTGDTFTYTIQGGADSVNFSIGGTASDELIIIDGILDFENKASYEVIVRTTDSTSATFDKTLNITVNDLNDAPSLVSITNSTLDELTDTSSGLSVGTLTTTDTDAGDTFTYSIAGGTDSASFSIGGAGSDELIITDGILDFETQSTYEVIVRSTDSGALFHDQTINITVNDLNDAPSLVSITNSTLDELTDTSSGLSVGTLTTTDTDAGDSFTYSIAGGTDSASFSIGGVGFDELIITDGILDFEAQSTYEVIVRSTDSGSLFHDQTINITVNDLNDAPSLVSISNSILDELTDTSSGVSVGTLTTTDTDAGDTFTYTITGGADSASFSIGGAGFDELIITDGILDFEAQSTYEVIVRSTDSGSLFHDQTINITVNDLNDAPSLVSITNSTLDELTDTSSGLSIGTLTTTDTDAGETFTYSIAGGIDSASFSIGGAGFDELIITDGILDFEAQSTYEVIVRSTDSGSLFHDQTINITVNDLNDAPSLVSISNSILDELTDTSSGVSVGTLTTTDTDAGDTFTYTITGGADSASFSIGGAGFDELIITDGILDFEAQATYEVIVRSTDSGSLFHDQTFNITVNDLNDAPSLVSISNSTLDELTDSSSGLSVGTLTTTDTDAGETFTYSIAGGTDSASFSIGGVGSDELIITDGILDFETQSTYEVIVRSTDSGSLFHDQTINITVNDLNDAPSLVSISNSTLDELTDTSSGLSVGTLTTTDTDAGDTFTYSIAGGTDSASFSIGGAGSDELIITDGILDFEAQATYEVIVRSTDSGSLFHDQTFNITVNDLNDAPSLVSITNSTLDELTDTSSGLSVGTLSTTDTDAGDTFTYTIAGGADSASFSIGGAGFDELIITDGILDFESQSTYEVIVRSTDSGSLFHDQTINITVNDLNDAPSLVSISNSTLDELTDTSSGVSVGTLTTTDTDVGDTFTYSIAGGTDSASFSIGGAGFDELIITDGILDFEAQATYEVIVRSTDSGALFHEQTINITVNDLNDAPVITSAASSSVIENNTTVLTVTATDVDLAQTISFSVSGGVDQGAFTINSVTGELSFSSAPDFESPADTNSDNIYEVEVTADDGNGGTDVQTITVSVTGINESTPTQVLISNSTIDEQTDTSAGFSIGTLSTTDSDVGDSFTYTVAGGTDQSFFTIGGSGADELIISAGVLNFESKSTYQVIVRSTDSGSLFYDEILTISVNDLNDAPIITTFSSQSVVENNTAVVTVVASDEDTGSIVTFSLSGGTDQSRFVINSTSGQLVFLSAPDFEVPFDFDFNNIYQVEVTADDGNGGIDTKSINVTVNDINEAPKLISISSSTVADQTDTSGGISIGSLSTDDEDAGDTFTYTISGGVDQGNFTIGGSSSDELIFDAGVVDFETKSSYEVSVRATDAGLLTHDQTLVISVIDANDAPVITSGTSANVAENSTAVMTVTATDVDVPVQTITYAVTGGVDQAAFTIDAASGALSFASAPDFEIPADSDSNNIYIIEVTADDGNGGTVLQTISVTVTDINEIPTLVSLSNSSIADQVNTTGGLSIGTLTTTDVDAGDTFTYSVVGGADLAYFSIGGGASNELFIDAGVIDFETKPSYEVVVRTTDSGTLFHDQTFTLTVTDVNDAPVITSSSTASVVENATAVLTVTATDADLPSQTITFAISGGADQSHFAINGSNGTLTFAPAPDFEAPADSDANNIYEVEVTASDGNGGTDVQTVSVTVTDDNDAPVITSSAVSSMAENTTAVLTVTATDADLPAQTITFAITGGDDQPLFTIDGASGALSFIAAPDFEAPADLDANNVYLVQVTANDGNLGTDVQTISVTVTDENEAPTLIALSNSSILDQTDTTGGYAIGTLTTTDIDAGDTFSYSVVGGTDQALFVIGGALLDELIIDNGVLDFETQLSYEVVVRTSDSGALTHDETLIISVSDTNDPPVFTSNAAPIVAENTTAIVTVSATDADLPAQTVTYSISGGEDQSLFSIDSASGVLAFVAAPNFETPTDADTNNIYLVEVTADDGNTGTTIQSLSITVTDANDAPIINSNLTPAIEENSTAISTVTVADEDVASTASFTISGGADQLLFNIDNLSGALSFVSAPDFEAPTDADTNNIYIVEVTADDGNGGTDVQTVNVTVTDGNDAPTLISISNSAVTDLTDTTGGFSIGILSTTDVDAGDSFTYSVVGGADQANFSISGAGSNELFIDDGVLDFETKSTYAVIVRSNDAGALFHDQTLTITVVDANDAPIITSSASPSITENTTAVLTVTATDADLPPQAITFSITGGDDQALFTIDGTSGALSFIAAPDFETPGDSDTNNVYLVAVTADDGNTGTNVQLISVTVADDNEAPTLISISNSTLTDQTDTNGGYAVGTLTTTDIDAGETFTYSIAGGIDSDYFSIGGAGSNELFIDNGIVDFETKSSYEVIVRTTDSGTLTHDETFIISVSDTNDPPVFTSTTTPSMAENTTAVITVTTTDADLPAQTVTYSISGGVDQSLFSIDNLSGALAFVAAPNFEAPADADTNNIYLIEVTADDGNTGTTIQSLSITVTDANDAPVINSNLAPAIEENSTAISTVTVADEDIASSATFSITGGADQLLFNIDNLSGALSFVSAPDFEVPTDADTNNIYLVEVTADDGNGGTDVQTINVTVTDGNDAPTLVSISNSAVADLAETTGGFSVGTLTTTDVDAGDSFTYSVVGGADQLNFAIGGALSDELLLDDGVLDFETKPSYEVIVRATDGGGLTYDQPLTITVVDANDAPVITSSAVSSVEENTTAVLAVTATDADLPAQTLTFSISGGDDQTLFAIDGTSGALSFIAAPDFEAPGDLDANNVYLVQVTADDGNLGTDVQLITVTITDTNDAPVITSTATAIVVENTTTVLTITSTDEDQPTQTVTYSLTGGADQSFFSINSSSGALSFIAAPDFEVLADFDGNNIYEVEVTANDGNGGTGAQIVSVTVTNANETPSLITLSNNTIIENTDTTTPVSVGLLSTTDVDSADTFTYSVSGGADATQFSIGGSGSDELMISNGILNYEAKSSYQVVVRTTDAGGLFYDETFIISVLDTNDAPVITSNATGDVVENTTSVMTVTATDSDFPLQTVSFALTGGVDVAHFAINSVSGQLFFLAARDYEAPADFDSNNIYEVEVSADDGNGGITPQLISVTITDINESPSLVSISASSVTDQTDTTGGFSIGTLTTTDVDTGDTFSYAVVGGADQVHFSIGGTFLDRLFIDDGILDFETQSSYEVVVRTTDAGALSHDETLTITIIDSNDAPTITSSATGIVAENTTSVLTVTATDVDVPAQTITFSITGGDDQALFAIDGASGALSFLTAPDYEIPGDVDSNNIYLVQVTADDGNGGSDIQTITITVTDDNDTPTMVSISNNIIADLTDTTGGLSIGSLTTTDQDPLDTFTYSVAGGADFANFAIGGAGNELIITDGVIDFETKSSYEVVVRSTDSGSLFHDQTFIITVTDVNDAPVITSAATANVVENTTAVLTVSATDADLPAQTISFTISGGADQGLFAINSSSGALSFAVAPDFEAPSDFDANNIYEVEVTANDGNGGTGSQTINVTVTDSNDAPVITSSAAPSVAENTTAVLTVTATDADVPAQTITFAITGGDDQTLFALDSASGALSFVAAPDFEAAGDLDTNNIYVVEVTAHDGNLGTDIQTISITVTDDNETPTLISISNSTVVDQTDTTGGSAVGTLTTTDIDTGDTFSYAVVGGADLAYFSIGGALSDELLIDNGVLDFETQASYEVIVRTTDSGALSHDETFIISVTDTNDPPVFTSSATPSVAENTTPVITVTSTDADLPAQSVTYSITGGIDQAHFNIDSVSGALAFVAAPNFEAPADADTDNIYLVEVTADDGNTGTTVQALSVTVSDANDAPQINSSATPNMEENSTAVITVTVTDEDASATATYSITGGLDQALFNINGNSGDLTFISAPDFEIPSDTDTNNVYQVEVTADDGNGGTDAQTISVTVTDGNDAPTLIAISNSVVTDLADTTGGMSVGTLTSTDVDAGDSFSYSVVGGADLANFFIGGAATDELLLDDGVLDFETQASYAVIVRTTDTGGLSHDQPLTITVVDANDAPVITSSATPDMAENTTAVLTVTATDADLPPQTITFAISGGDDQAMFAIDGASGALSFLAAPDFETPGDIDANNIYLVEVTANDGNLGTQVQLISVSVTDANDAPVITSSASADVAENTTTVMTVTATDEDVPAQTVTFSISGGVDQSLFSINASTGVLTFISAPDYEIPTDFDANNVYEVAVTADDANSGTVTQTINVTVTTANETPSLISISNSALAENIDTTTPVSVGTLTTTDTDAGDTFTYTISGGTDQARFSIGGAASDELLISHGVLNYEAKSSYSVIVRTTDAGGLFHDESFTITINDLNDAPVITSASTRNVAENTTTVTTVSATDEDLPPQTITFSLTGGNDFALFAINSGSGQLAFLASPDFEIPSDLDSNNIYEVEVTANDGSGGVDTQLINVTVTDANDAPDQVTISSNSLNELTDTTGGLSVGTLTTIDVDAVDSFTYTVVGGADQIHFSIGGLYLDQLIIDDGVLDFESQSSYEVIVRTTDSGSLTHDETLTITVLDVNDAPTITSPASASVTENSTAVITVTASDVDLPLQTITFSITGGADQSLFTIDSASGALSFASAPDFEIPGDADTNNIYQIEVTADDGTGGTDAQTINVTVTDTNDAPTLVTLSNSIIDENINTGLGVSIGTLTTTDQDAADTFSYSIIGGIDMALFSVAGTNLDELILTDGVLNFELKASYDVIIRTTDAGSLSHDQPLTVIVNNVNDAPVGTVAINGTVAEDQILTADPSGLADEDGLGVFSYQWQRDSVNIAGATAITYTLGDDDVGTSMTVVVSYVDLGGTAENVISSATIPVVNVNDPPVGNDAAVSPVEDTTFNGTLTATDIDNLAADFIFTRATNATHGEVTVNADGTYQYVPEADYDGTDSFTFMVNDGTDDALTVATVSMTLQPVNDAPIGTSAPFTVDENQVLNGNLTATDVDNAIGDLTFRLGSGTLNGVTIVNADGSFQYTPTPAWNGTDSFTFIVNDGTADSLEATINITVLPENHAPIANDLTFSTDVDVPFGGVLTGSDVDDDPIFYFLETTGTLGTAIITSADGQFWYTPNPGAVGIDTFTFKATDGYLDSQTATVTVIIGDVNSVPVAHDGLLDVVMNTPSSGRMLMSDFDAGDTHTFSIVAPGNKGFIEITDPSTGAYTYTPFSWNVGTDIFTFIVNDGTDDSNIAQVTVTIVPSVDSHVTQLISASETEPGTGSSFNPALSADGSYVAFLSYATNLVDGVSGGQVYVYDRMNNAMHLVSKSTAGDPGDGTSDYPSINNDGQFIAYYSFASNLVPGDTNGVRDIFVHDRGTGLTEMVSISTAGDLADGDSYYPAITNDGNFVAFDSSATNLMASDANGTSYDIFIHNRLTDTTELVSLSTGGVQSNRNSRKPSISSDGRFVAFESQATNLIDGIVGQQIYVRDRQSGTLTQVSVSSAGTSGNGSSQNASISADGRFVVFQSTSSNLVADDTNGVTDIFVHDRLTGNTERVSVSTTGGQTNDHSYCYFQNSISADGQYIVFHSSASNLVGDTNAVNDIFVHDRSTGVTRRISSSSLGTQSDNQSWWPSISADGLIKSFSSSATNLVDNDANGAWDVFLIHPVGN
ncbi:MAG: cadherin domain-containing protein [Desulfobulbaceae bacterium]|nr:cadherin domain-containing protein [Desulfobulbaceae bacterium]